VSTFHDHGGKRHANVSVAWNKVTVDILIQALPGASGSLIRLLKSLSAADFTACSIPHLTIELPHDVDGPTTRYLEKFQWPPAHIDNPSNVRQLTLRHRIPTSRMTEEESSVRFLESFWPADPVNSHVLVLSPQTELSPRFYHCKWLPCVSIVITLLTAVRLEVCRAGVHALECR
jgi:hypothetical protein